MRLIADNIDETSSSSMNPNNPLYGEFMEFLRKKKGNTPSYLKAATEEENDDSQEYYQTSYKEKIIILEYQDVLRYFEAGNDPWILLTRYLDTASYAAGSYKSRAYYENILRVTGSCEISHFTAANSHVYNFSKTIIKQVISAEEWGLSTLKEKEFINEQKMSVKYNYWDYIESFHKAFLYINPKRKHSWFFKVCPKAYNKQLPNWFIQWWKSYGPSIQILQEPFKGYYVEWVNVSPKLIDSITKNNGGKEILPSLHFFTEFSIPWIWKWNPEVNYSVDQIPHLQRVFFTKFWKKMLSEDKQTGESISKETIELIKNSIAEYKAQAEFKRQKNNPTPYEQIMDKLKAQGKKDLSKEEILEEYLKEIKEDLIKNFECQKSDSSMKTISEDDNQFNCLAGESQPEESEEMPLEDIFEEMKNTVFRRISKGESSSGKDK